MSYRRLLPLLVLCLLQACASQAPALRDSQWLQHQAQLSGLDHWEFSGKVALRTADNAESARLQWTQHAQRSRVVLSGPMGWNSLTLLLDDDQLTLLRDGEAQLLADSGQLGDMIGWDLPVESLRWWVRGLPAPGLRIGDIQLVDGRLSVLQQDGWQLAYEAYSDVDGVVLPGRIRFEKPGISGKILLKRWKPVL